MSHSIYLFPSFQQMFLLKVNDGWSSGVGSDRSSNCAPWGYSCGSVSCVGVKVMLSLAKLRTEANTYRRSNVTSTICFLHKSSWGIGWLLNEWKSNVPVRSKESSCRLLRRLAWAMIPFGVDVLGILGWSCPPWSGQRWSRCCPRSSRWMRSTGSAPTMVGLLFYCLWKQLLEEFWLKIYFIICCYSHQAFHYWSIS